MKARAKGNPHSQKPKASGGGNPRSGSGGRPDSAPARTATAPAAMMAVRHLWICLLSCDAALQCVKSLKWFLYDLHAKGLHS